MSKKEDNVTFANWTKMRFGDCASLINGRAYGQQELLDTGKYKVIRIQNLNNGFNWYFSDLELEKDKYCEKDDLLFAWSATFGPYIWKEDKAIFHYHIWKVVSNPDILDKDFAYFLLTQITAKIRANARGIAMLHFTKESMENHEIEIPSIEVQRKIAIQLKSQLAEVEKASNAAEAQIGEIQNLANSIINESIRFDNTKRHKLGDVLREIKKGIGESWEDYPVLGATRNGLALAKEPPGKTPQRYKPVVPGTVFYNPMRILIGSIAIVDDDDPPGITSPDYVVLQGEEGLLDSRWFYYWLRSPLGEQCISSLARGAVRERMLFNRLAEGEIELPEFSIQKKASESLKELVSIKKVIKQQMDDLKVIPNKLLAQAFKME